MDDLGRLIVEHEDWLTDRVVHYAHQHDYTRFSSTLREAWRSSIIGFAQPIVDALEEMGASGIASSRPIEAAVAYGIQEARNHRARGVDTALFLGLLKFYRRSYFDLVEEKVTALPDRHRMTAVLLGMFDAIELELVRDAATTKSDTELDRLRSMNRDLANEKNKYLTVFESIAEPAILIDQNDLPLHMNAAGYRILLGEDAPGSGYYGNPDMKGLRRILAEILPHADGGTEPARVTLDTAIGSRAFSISAQEMLDISRKFAGRVIILKDVTDYLAATEAAKDAERAKSALLTMFSHEIKTPINGIIALTRLIDDDRLAPEHRRHIGALKASGKLLTELVENILGLSRAEANALQRLDQDFDLSDLLQDVLLVIEPDARAKGLTTAVEIAADVPCRLHGDMPKLRHILTNLMTNAVKFTSRGGVFVRVRAQPTTFGRTRQVQFEVADTGVGLPAGAKDWLFDPFTQYVHTGVEHGLRGTGLGLAICRQFVTFLGGTISARSALAGGSVFTFDLPFEVATLPRSASRPHIGLAVLLVEDDPVNALLAEGYLNELGHDPVVAGSFSDALWQLRTSRFDVVITDNRLDGATGVDIARHLRNAQERRLNGLPVILITAALPDSTAFPPGTFQYVIEKPLERKELARAIDHVMHASVAARGDEAASPTDGRSESAPVETLLDKRVMKQLLADLGAERCKRIVDSYVANAPRLAHDLARAMAASDLVAVSDHAHKLFSAASVVGMSSVATSARDLLHACKAGRTLELKSAQSLLQDQIRQSCVELAAHCDELTQDFGTRT